MSIMCVGEFYSDGVYINVKNSSITSSIDEVSKNRISGWCLPSNCESNANICLEYHGKPIVNFVANKTRIDLIEAGFGHGNFGFDIDISIYNIQDVEKISLRHISENKIIPITEKVFTYKNGPGSFSGMCKTEENSSLSGEYSILSSVRPSLDIDICSGFFSTSNSNTDVINFPIFLKEGDKLSTDTYFNAFFYTQWSKVIGKRKLFLFVKASGNAEIRIFSSSSDGNKRTLAYYSLNGREDGEWFLLPIPSTHTGIENVRIYFDINAFSSFKLHRALYATKEALKRAKSNLFILLRTFMRKHDCSRLITSIVSDERFSRSDIKFIVLDTSNDIDGDEFSKLPSSNIIQVIKSQNYGSSGNLNKIQYEIEKSGYNIGENDVAVIIDDDVHIDPETILRSWALIRMSNSNNYIISGAMLDKSRPIYNESVVGVYGSNQLCSFSQKIPLSVSGVLGNMRIDEKYFLDMVTNENLGNMAAFYFVSMNMAQFFSRSLSPFFLKYDDVDFTYSLHKNGCRIEHFAGIAVWHDSFYLSMPAWQDILNIRHGMICDAIHQNFLWTEVFPVLENIVGSHLRVHDYNIAEGMISAIEEFLLGPSSAFECDYKLKSEKLIHKLSSEYNLATRRTISFFKNSSVISMAFDSGSMNLRIDENHECEIVHELFPDPKRTNLRYYLKYNRKKNSGYICEEDSERRNDLDLRMKKIEEKGFSAYKSISKLWKGEYESMVSKEFWRSIFHHENC